VGDLLKPEDIALRILAVWTGDAQVLLEELAGLAELEQLRVADGLQQRELLVLALVKGLPLLLLLEEQADQFHRNLKLSAHDVLENQLDFLL